MDAERSAGTPDFESWVAACFTLSADDLLGNRSQPSGAQLAEYLARLFESSAFLATRYSREQLAKGLWWVCGCVSGYCHEALDATIPEAGRHRWLRGVSHLYTELIDPLCERFSFGEIDGDPLCTAAYMLWDMDSLEGATFRPELHDDCLYVLQTALDCNSAACVRSGLHGLGHWIGRAEFAKDAALAQRLRHLIDAWLKRRPELSREMIQYARDARADRIL